MHGVVAWLAIALVASGCAIRDIAPTPAPRWEGRLSLSVAGPPPRQLTTAFELDGNAQQGQLQLFSPLGTVISKLSWSTQQAFWQQGSDIQYFSDVSSMTESATGAALPMGALFDWLAGIPTPAPGWELTQTATATQALVATRRQPAPQLTLKIVLQP